LRWLRRAKAVAAFTLKNCQSIKCSKFRKILDIITLSKIVLLTLQPIIRNLGWNALCEID